MLAQPRCEGFQALKEGEPYRAYTQWGLLQDRVQEQVGHSRWTLLMRYTSGHSILLGDSSLLFKRIAPGDILSGDDPRLLG